MERSGLDGGRPDAGCAGVCAVQDNLAFVPGRFVRLLGGGAGPGGCVSVRLVLAGAEQEKQRRSRSQKVSFHESVSF